MIKLVLNNYSIQLKKKLHTVSIHKFLKTTFVAVLLSFFTFTPVVNTFLEIFDTDYDLCELTEKDTEGEEEIDDEVEEGKFLVVFDSALDITSFQNESNYFKFHDGYSQYCPVIFLPPPELG